MIKVNLNDFFPSAFRNEERFLFVTDDPGLFHPGVNNPPMMRGFFPAIRRIKKGRRISDWYIHNGTLEVLQSGRTIIKLSDLYKDEVDLLSKPVGRQGEKAAELRALRNEMADGFQTIENSFADVLFAARREEIARSLQERENGTHQTAIDLIKADKIPSNSRDPAFMIEWQEEKRWERKAVCCAFNSLSAEQQSCVFANIVECKLQKDIATESNRHISTVSINISRAIDNMRAYMENPKSKPKSENCASCNPAIRLAKIKEIKPGQEELS